MADVFEGGQEGWGVPLIGAWVLQAKPRLLGVDAGGHGRCVAEAVLMSEEFDLVGFLDDGAFSAPALKTDVWGLPELGAATDFVAHVSHASHAVVAIGNNVLRQKLCALLQAAGFELACVVHPCAIVSPRAQLDVGVAVMAGAIVGTKAVLGQGAIVNCGAVVDRHARVHDFGHLGVNACMAGGSVLNALAWMQTGAVIGYGVQLAAGKVLQPGKTRA